MMVPLLSDDIEDFDPNTIAEEEFLDLEHATSFSNPKSTEQHDRSSVHFTETIFHHELDSELTAFPQNVYFLFTNYSLVNELFDLKSLPEEHLKPALKLLIVVFYLFQAACAGYCFMYSTYFSRRFPGKLSEKLLSSSPTFAPVR
jgi:hypothetical protein